MRDSILVEECIATTRKKAENEHITYFSEFIMPFTDITAIPGAAGNRKKKVYVPIGTNSYVQLNVKTAAYTPDIITALGYSTTPPTGKRRIGVGQEAAIQNGCGIAAITYVRGTETVAGEEQQVLQQQRVVVAPEKMDELDDLIGKQWHGTLEIVAVEVPSRKVFSL